MHGFVNIYKPPHMTSRDALDFVKEVCKPTKTGHTGTLDPMADGVLVTCIGDTTRLADFCQQMRKQYRASFRLDCRSETLDAEDGFEQLEQRSADVTQNQIENRLTEFLGTIKQVPPKFSAAKIGGRRAYKLARQGKSFELKPRDVCIDSIQIISYEYPILKLDIRCGGGTYIRSLGRDIAERLKTEAVMTELTRTSVGQFQLDDALDCRQITLSMIRQNLHPPVAAVSHLAKYQLTREDISELGFGRFIPFDASRFQSDENAATKEEIFAGLNEQGDLLSLLMFDDTGTVIRPNKNFKFE